MRIRWSFFCLVPLAFLAMSFEASGDAQEALPLKVVSAQRTMNLVQYNTRSFPAREEVFRAKHPGKDLVLVVRVDNISADQWDGAVNNKEIYVADGEIQHRPEITMASQTFSAGSTTSCYVLVFVVPKTRLEFTLVFGDRSLPFEATPEVVERLDQDGLCK